MQRKKAQFQVSNNLSRNSVGIPNLKQKLLEWGRTFGIFTYLDNNSYSGYQYSSYDLLIGAGEASSVKPEAGNAFGSLKNFLDKNKDWCFGFFSYDLKNQVEHLASENEDHIEMPDLYFYQPEIVILLKDNILEIQSLVDEPEKIFQKIEKSEIPEYPQPSFIEIKSRISRGDYIDKIKAIRQHIEEGDVYELNLCQEFFAENVKIDPFAVFDKLNNIAKAPFSVFLKYEEKYLLCTSPERFLRKEKNKLISQPIKGTIRRGATPEEDEILKSELENDVKERAENVMIVDLVRNDLTRSAKTGTIKVEELFKIYSFENVNQMISTITAALADEVHPVDAIRNAFPMGSMTGAPKVMAMELIEQYEETKRGLYSGAVGYFTPEMDFDFNVVIRSILYNSNIPYLSFQVGGAITYDSVPEKEFEETLLKAENLKRALKASRPRYGTS